MSTPRRGKSSSTGSAGTRAIFSQFSFGRATQKERFRGELFPNVVDSGSGLVFAGFFQNERDGGRKGIVVHHRRILLITNEVQRRSTEAHLQQFETAIANLEAKTKKPTKLTRLEVDALRSQAADLRSELDEYDHLRSGAVSTFEASSLEDLASLLIKARIARGWSQRELADTLGVAEQQIQRYESTGYRSASLARIADVATALNATITERLTLRGPDTA